jgi:hypothetical protein
VVEHAEEGKSMSRRNANRLGQLCCLVVLVGVFVACGDAETVTSTWVQPLFKGTGAHHRAVDPSSPEAQVFFDQGLAFVYAFNHDEAT